MRKFAIDNHSYKDKSPIVNKFSHLLHWGFLIIATFTIHNPVLPQLTGQNDYLNNLNGITSTKTSTGNGYTMYNLDVKRHPAAFVDELQEEGFKLNLKG